MIFYILVALIALIVAVAFLLFAYSLWVGDDDGVKAALGLGFLMPALPIMPVLVVWSVHASDLGTISSQSEVIEVYESRIEALESRLDGITYTGSAFVNADSPVAAIVESLTEAERHLAQVRAERAMAIRSIERRRQGPMSGVIWFVGDYK